MKRHVVSLALSTGVFLLATMQAHADQWQIVGPRALGMGGAHVAVVNDATAQYWNPAAFGFFGRQADEDEARVDEHSGRDFGVYMHGGIGYQTHEDIIGEVDDITKINFDVISNDITSGGLDQLSNVDDFVRIVGELEDLQKENIGVTALVNGGLNLRFRSIGLGGMAFVDIGAIPQLDLVNINPDTASTNIIDELGTLQTDTGANGSFDALTDDQVNTLNSTFSGFANWTDSQRDEFLLALDDALAAAGYDKTTKQVPQEYIDAAADVGTLANNAVTGGSFDNNTSTIQFKGALVMEIPLTYGRALNDNFAVGGNIKAMKARTYYTEVRVFDSNTDDFFDKAKDDYLESSDFGVDLGMLYKKGAFRFGMVGRNLNKPSFDWKGPGDYEVDPQVRAGVALRMWDFVTLAADVDVTENDTNISDNYKSRNLGVGAEFDLLSFLRLRAGMYKNLSESDIGPVYTVGFGLNFYLFQLDAAAALSKDTAMIDGDKLPEEVRGELALSFQF